jgi:prepilin-type N-terminal cleavage/methylation domain-containing protein
MGRRRRRPGFSLAETLVTVALLGLAMLVAIPALRDARARVDVAAARDAFVATHSLARRAAVQYGGLSRLHLDPARGAFWVTADTGSAPGGGPLDTIMPPVRVPERFRGVTLEAAPRVFCFDPRGIATPRGDCDLPNATVVFRRGDFADTVTISRLGRVRVR